MPKTESDKRLRRLINSGICPAEDASEYATELVQIANQMAESQTIKKQARVFKAMADETRLRILKLLGLREMCVCEVMIALSLTQPTASHHLGILEDAGLIRSKKEGKWVFYSLTNPKQTKNILKQNF